MPEVITSEAFTNAKEKWPLYDTVQIRNNLKGDTNKGYAAYSVLPSKIPFFNVRTEGEVGSSMCNLESKDSLAFGFELASIGVSFAAPVGDIPGKGENNAGKHNAAIPLIFTQDLPRHVALRLQVRQDDKLLANCYLAPEGVGPYGFGLAADVNLAGQTGWGYANTITQGEPEIRNRWAWGMQNPIVMPRGCTVRAILELDDYILDQLKAWPGPGDLEFCPDGVTAIKKPACALIRVSMFGARYVQQRNALHV